MTECIVCGCTDDRACFDQQSGQTCAWVEFEPGLAQIDGKGLCSFCAYRADAGDVDVLRTLELAIRRGFTKEKSDEPLVQLYSDYEATEYLRARAATM